MELKPIESAPRDGTYDSEMVAKLLARRRGPLVELPADETGFIDALMKAEGFEDGREQGTAKP